MSNKPILVIGAGSWGTALAIVLARNNLPVLLWDIDSEHIQRIRSSRSNEQYIPGISFPESLEPTENLQTCLEKTSEIVISTPCSALEAVLTELRKKQQVYNICLTCKGLAPGKHLLNHKVVDEFMGDSANVAVLSGPSFAIEVARGLPTAVAIASSNHKVAQLFSGYFHSDLFRVYTQDDIIGVQVGGAVKNVMAIAAGIADGLGFGANTRAALITRGLAEIMRLGVALGGRQETFIGLAGLGDLVLTCTDDQSRNRRFGLLLAGGKTMEEALDEIRQTVEGLRTVKELVRLSEEHSIQMPISEQVYNVLYQGLSPNDAVQSLLSREQKQELD